MRAASGTACTLVSSALLQTFSAVPDGIIDMNEFLNNEQPAGNGNFNVKVIELSSTNPIEYEMSHISKTLSDVQFSHFRLNYGLQIRILDLRLSFEGRF